MIAALARHTPAPGPANSSPMASLATRRDEAIPNGLQTTFLASLPRSIRSSHLFLLAFATLLVSTLQAALFPTATSTATALVSSPVHQAAHASQDGFESFATPVLDAIDSISSPAVITSCGLIIVATLVRGAENAFRSLGSKGRCC